MQCVTLMRFRRQLQGENLPGQLLSQQETLLLVFLFALLHVTMKHTAQLPTTLAGEKHLIVEGLTDDIIT